VARSRAAVAATPIQTTTGSDRGGSVDRSNYVYGKSKHFHSWRELLDRQHNRARCWRCHTSTDRKAVSLQIWVVGTAPAIFSLFVQILNSM
jgi:hypothetical protein